MWLAVAQALTMWIADLPDALSELPRRRLAVDGHDLPGGDLVQCRDPAQQAVSNSPGSSAAKTR